MAKILNGEKTVEFLNEAFTKASDEFDAAHLAFTNARDEKTRKTRMDEMTEANGKLKAFNNVIQFVGKNVQEVTAPEKETRAE